MRGFSMYFWSLVFRVILNPPSALSPVPSFGSRRLSRAVGPKGEGCCHRVLIESVMSLSHEIRKHGLRREAEKLGSRHGSNSPPLSCPTGSSAAGGYPVPWELTQNQNVVTVFILSRAVTSIDSHSRLGFRPVDVLLNAAAMGGECHSQRSMFR